MIYGYEFKWKTKSNVKLSETFVKTYHVKIKVIDRKNFPVTKHPLSSFYYQ